MRSSSLLEDSQLQPFAGIYATFMLPNNHDDPEERFGQLCRAIKAVWASTYSDDARAYIARTPYTVEEEKMAVLIQEVVGHPYESERFYPHISGVAVSYNYYPIGHQRAEDGLAYVALGLGQQLVQGGAGLQFSPGEPSVLPQFGSAQDYLRYTQKRFYALDLTQHTPDFGASGATRQYDLKVAEADGTLALVGSVYAPDDDAIRDDLATPGPRVVSFHNVLRWEALPLAAALKELLALFREGFGGPVEIEFAIDAGNLGHPPPSRRLPRKPCLYVLQVRPQATQALEGTVETEGFDESRVLCRTDRSLGHGVIEGIRDIVYVKRSDLQATETPGVAGQVGALNAQLCADGAPYLLIGPGRWGSSDPRLGIPVKSAQNIGGARHRRDRVPGSRGRALPGGPLLPQRDGVPDRIPHNLQRRSARGRAPASPRRGMARGAARGGRPRRGAARPARATDAGAAGWSVEHGDDLEAAAAFLTRGRDDSRRLPPPCDGVDSRVAWPHHGATWPRAELSTIARSGRSRPPPWPWRSRPRAD